MGYQKPISDLCTLVLNADMQPLSWGPLSVWCWQDALVAVLQGRVHEISSYDIEVRSATRSFKVPSVVSLKTYHKRSRISFTRYHVFLRDSFRCQYCDRREESTNLTFDHVVPRSKGGTTCWTNIVTCCAKHNLQKADKTLKQSGLSLRRQPFEPSPMQLDGIAKKQPFPDNLHSTWLDYLYWDTTLEP